MLRDLIRNIENIQDLQIDIDIELMNNGGEITEFIEAKQKAIDHLSKELIEAGTDDLINAFSILDGRIESMKIIERDAKNARSSVESLKQRLKNEAGARFAVAESESLLGSLGAIKVRDEIVLGEIDKDKVEDSNKFIVVKYLKEDYNEAEFKLGELISEVSKKEEINQTRIKKHGSNGAEIIKRKTITIYKKRGSKKQND